MICQIDRSDADIVVDPLEMNVHGSALLCSWPSSGVISQAWLVGFATLAVDGW